MVTQDSVYVLGVPDGAIEVSVEGLRGIFRQIETELCRSEPYERVMTELETMPSDLSKQVQQMVRSVGREAIRLVFRKLIRRKDAIEIQSDKQPMMNLSAVSHFNMASPIVPPPPPPQNPHPESLLMTESSHESLMAAVHLESSLALEAAPQACLANSGRGSSSLSQLTSVTKPAKPTKRLSKAEQAAQALLQAREVRLQELGEEIRQIRQAKNMSLYELHSKTLIAVHQLEALEAGQVDRLPEDIYIRGFMRRLGDALGINGIELAESIPHLDPAKTAIPSWYKPRVKSKLPSTYLFLGYAALMAGGLAWVSQQTLPTTTAPATTPFVPETEDANQPSLSTKVEARDQRQSSAPTPVAPPESKPTKRQWANQ